MERIGLERNEENKALFHEKIRIINDTIRELNAGINEVRAVPIIDAKPIADRMEGTIK